MSTTIRPPLQDALVEMSAPRPGFATPVFQSYLDALNRALPKVQTLYVEDFGALGNGSDDTPGVQKAIDYAVKLGGGAIVFQGRDYHLRTVTIPAGTAPISVLGQAESTVLHRLGDLEEGKGMLDIYGSNVTLDAFAIDGGVTSPTGLLYNGGFLGTGGNDPMAASLTRNTSVWLHGGTSNFTVQRVAVRHTGGYAILIDAGAAGITDVQIFNCKFEQNRPHLFGVTAGEELYGSWTGGVYVNGDGRASNPGCVLKRFLVAQCRFMRNTGNCLWVHAYGLEELHEDFQFIDNYFLDCGLDGILVGAVTGGIVKGNVFRRIGYVTTSDTDRGTPRWLVNLNATALDSSGLVKNVPYLGNSFFSINGGCLDLDNHGNSVVAGNVCKLPFSDEPEYDEDQIASTGPNNNDPWSYGVNCNNSANTPHGDVNLTITGNTFVNLPGGAVRLFGARRCLVSNNMIVSPDAPNYPPVGMGPIGPGPYQRCSENKVCHNQIHYSPATAAPAVFEDPQISPFTAQDVNHVFGNTPVMGTSGFATEFQKDVNSGSPEYAETVWFT